MLLTKRAQILFDEQNYALLAALADEQEVSVGELVRKAVWEKYLSDKRIDDLKKRVRYCEMLAWQKKIGKAKKIDYKQLVEDGRYR